mgnify:FL=1
MNVKSSLLRTVVLTAAILLNACSSVPHNSGLHSPGVKRSLASDKPQINYCLAIRGNGQNVSAHWGALGQIIEDYGMPNAMSGGSSATVTQFLMDSLATNQYIQSKSYDQQRAMFALIMKSLPHLLESFILRTDEISSAIKVFTEFQQELGQKQAASGQPGAAEITASFATQLAMDPTKQIGRAHV